MSLSPASASRPEREFSTASISSVDRLRVRRRCRTSAGSTSPERVPITSPSSGVSPIEVSIAAPACTALALTRRCRGAGRSRRRPRRRGRAAARPRARRTRARCRGSRSGARPTRAAPRRCTRAAAAWRGTRCRRRRRAGGPGSARRATSIPSALTGLCSGASTARSRIAASTASLISTGAEKRSPPWTTRWATTPSAVQRRARPAPASSAAAWSVDLLHGPATPSVSPASRRRPTTSATRSRS